MESQLEKAKRLLEEHAIWNADAQRNRERRLSDIAEVEAKLAEREPELWAELQGQKAALAAHAAMVDSANAQAVEEIKKAVTIYGTTVKGSRYQAVYSVRTNWDGKKLDGLALAVPQIRECRSETVSVSIREVK